jgi:hypothetical protein
MSRWFHRLTLFLLFLPLANAGTEPLLEGLPWVDKVLVVYNQSSADSLKVLNYYRTQRPGFQKVQTLAVNLPDSEIITEELFNQQLRDPIAQRLRNNKNKIHYLVLLQGIPSRVAYGDLSNFWYQKVLRNGPPASVQVLLSTVLATEDEINNQSYPKKEGEFKLPIHTSFNPESFPGTTVLVTHLSMGSTEATLAYIDKLKKTGQAMKTPHVILSTRTEEKLSSGIYYFDDAERKYPIYPWGDFSRRLLTWYCPYAQTWYSGSNHITRAHHVSGYMTWGANGNQGYLYPLDGKVSFSGNSNWYLIFTVESFNGQKEVEQGNFTRWFDKKAFGGSNYEYTPVGAVTHVEEPRLIGVSSGDFFAMWEKGHLFIEAAWASRRTPYFMAIGDPLIKK